MFFVNTYRWDFPQVAALIAPRPLLIGNSDKDPLFPLDGVLRVYEKTRRIYQLYGATNQLGLLITEGPHADTQDLQVPVFRWFNRFLKGEQPLIEMAATKFFQPLELRVFDELPADELNTKIQETFGPKTVGREAGAPGVSLPGVEGTNYLEALRQKVFAGWPAHGPAANAERCVSSREGSVRAEVYEFASQPKVNLRLYVLRDTKAAKPETVLLTVLDAEGWTNSPARYLWLGGEATGTAAGLRQAMQQAVLVFFAPRAVEPLESLRDPKKATEFRRRYMLLGQTLDGMRVWDIRCAAQALHALPEFKRLPLVVRARGQMGVNAGYAALFEPEISRLELEALPASHREGPDYLNVLRVGDVPQMLERLGGRVVSKR